MVQNDKIAQNLKLINVSSIKIFKISDIAVLELSNYLIRGGVIIKKQENLGQCPK